MNDFRQLLEAKTPLGTWLMAESPATAEALGNAGMDFLVADMEHVAIGIPELSHILRAISCTNAVPIVRLAWNDQVLVKRVMDAGAETLMIPFVQNAEEAKEAVSYMRYPPHGVRGVAAMHRGSRYGRIPDYLKTAHERVFSILQLETVEAVENVEEIAAVEAVDGLFLGPADLSASMGLIGELNHPDVQKMIAHAAKAAKAAGKPIGIVGPNPDMVKRFLGYGYSFAATASDVAMMTTRAKEWLADLRDSDPVATSEAAY